MENRLILAAIQRCATASDDELLRLAAVASDPAIQEPIDLAIWSAASGRSLLVDAPRRTKFVPLDPANRYSFRCYQRSRRRALGCQGGADGRLYADRCGA